MRRNFRRTTGARLQPLVRKKKIMASGDSPSASTFNVSYTDDAIVMK